MIPEKYGITGEAYKAMIKDGIISCSWPRFEAVYQCFTKHKNQSGEWGALARTAEEMDMPVSTVATIVKKFK